MGYIKDNYVVLYQNVFDRSRFYSMYVCLPNKFEYSYLH